MQTIAPRPREDLYHVSEINWSDPTIHRASITPILVKGSKYQIGLGVTNSTAVMVTIGGAFEAKDGDLLVTAVREYNEETGSSLKEIEVLDCYVLYNKGTVNILLPVADRIEFKPNKELERVLWLTTSQATIISRNQTYNYQGRYGTLRVLTMSQALINEVPLLVRAVDSGIPFKRQLFPFRYMRTYKVPEVKQTRFSSNVNQLRADIRDPSLFYGSAALAVRGDYVSFERRDKAVYALTAKDFDELMSIIRVNKIKIYVGFDSEIETYSTVLDRQRILSIEGRIKKFSKAVANKESLQLIWKTFQDKINAYRKYPDAYAATWETVLIHETEEAIYRVTDNIPFANNRLRSSFFEALDLANMYVLSISAIGANVLFWELADFLFERQGQKIIRPSDSLNTMIDLGLLTLDGDIINVV